MSLVRRGAPVIPALEPERVHVPALNGDVLVRSMGLSERFLFESGQGFEKFENVSAVLARCVLGEEPTLDAQGNETGTRQVPLMTQAEWEAWGRDHMLACFDLLKAVRRVSLLDPGSAEKKSESTPSS